MFLNAVEEVQVVPAGRVASLADCQKDLQVAYEKIDQLKALVAAKDDLISAKEEMLMLLRMQHNRPK